MDQHKNCLIELSKKYKNINIVDVGCARGALLSYARDMRVFDKIYSIGIDPLDHAHERPEYSAYLQCAVDNVGNKEEISDFFVNNDDQASSLLPMNFEHISDSLDERSEKYYVPWAKMLGIKSKISVRVFSLELILNKIMPERKIHLLKIDAEGKDLDIVKSLGSWSSVPDFISLECSAHKNDEIRIFKKGCHVSDVIPYMEGIGYSVFERFNYEEIPNNLTQACDIIFINNQQRENK